jgi:hypothetical protein
MEHKNDQCTKEEQDRAQTSSTNLPAFDDLMLTKKKEDKKIAPKRGTSFVGEHCTVNNNGAVGAVPKANSRRRSMV